MDFGIQVLVLGVVGVLSEAVRCRSVALADGRLTLVVGRCNDTGESEQSGCVVLIHEGSGFCDACVYQLMVSLPRIRTVKNYTLTLQSHASPEQFTCWFEQVKS